MYFGEASGEARQCHSGGCSSGVDNVCGAGRVGKMGLIFSLRQENKKRTRERARDMQAPATRKEALELLASAVRAYSNSLKEFRCHLNGTGTRRGINSCPLPLPSNGLTYSGLLRPVCVEASCCIDAAQAWSKDTADTIKEQIQRLEEAASSADKALAGGDSAIDPVAARFAFVAAVCRVEQDRSTLAAVEDEISRLSTEEMSKQKLDATQEEMAAVTDTVKQLSDRVNQQSKAADAPRISAAELEALREQAASNPREAGERLLVIFPDLTTLQLHAGMMRLRGQTWDVIQKQCKCARATLGKALARFYEVTGFVRPDRKGGFNGKMFQFDENRDAAKPIPEDEMN